MRIAARACAVPLGLALAAPAVDAQDLAERVAAVGNGVALMSYPLRDGAEICDRGLRLADVSLRWRGPERASDACRDDWVEVELTVWDGSVRDVEVLDLDEARAAGGVDLGRFGAPEAVAYFLTLARGRADQPPLEDAVLAAALAAVDGVWRDLLAIARDRSLDPEVRRNALFWVAQDAAEAVSVGIAAVAVEEREDQDVREAAVFALSRRPDEEGLPVLMELARSAPQAETRRTAMFWLAQSRDERVSAFFEEILLGRSLR